MKIYKQTIKAETGGEINLITAEENGQKYLFVEVTQGNLHGVHLTRKEVKTLMKSLGDYLWEADNT